MEKDILIVPGPSFFPENKPHEEIINDLCGKYTFVILLTFGDDEYNIRRGYSLPLNARLVCYDYESLDDSVEKIRSYLASFGVSMFSRHTSSSSRPLPFVMTGSIFQTPPDVRLEILEEYSAADRFANAAGVDYFGEWDVL